MRNPNGYGSVVKLSGKRRKPYMVRKTVGWDDRGYPVYEVIGYYATRKEGMIVLAEYNKTPWDIDSAKMTFEEVYKAMMEKKNFGESSINGMRSAFHYCEKIKDYPYVTLRTDDFQDIIDSCDKSYATKSNIRKLFSHMDRFALEHDVITKGYAKFTTTPAADPKEKKIFTDEEVKRLWEDFDETSKIILVLLYTGMRISELQIMEIDKENQTIRTGVKTRAGKNRIIPIHHLIKDFIKPVKNVRTFRPHFMRKMEELGMHHTPHECRHTFRSKLDAKNGNRRSIDLIMGHSSGNIGLEVYTHKSLEELRRTVELVTY